MQFRKGDKVVVIDGGTDNPGTEGRTGTVFYPGPDDDGQVTVKGIDGRLAEAVKGYRSYAPEQLRRA